MMNLSKQHIKILQAYI